MARIFSFAAEDWEEKLMEGSLYSKALCTLLTPRRVSMQVPAGRAAEWKVHSHQAPMHACVLKNLYGIVQDQKKHRA